jgi:hypothetical protein
MAPELIGQKLRFRFEPIADVAGTLVAIRWPLARTWGEIPPSRR